MRQGVVVYEKHVVRGQSDNSCSECFLNCFNLTLILNGLVAIVLFAFFGQAVSFLGVFAASISLGVFLVLAGCLGYCAVEQNSKCLTLIYILGLLMIGMAVATLGVVFLVYSDELGDAETRDSFERSIQDFQLAAFEECCDGNADLCSEGENRFCISNEGRFEDFKDSISDLTCNFLEDIEIEGDPLVGDVADGGCGEGSARAFVQDFDAYLEENLQGLVISGVLILLLLIAACRVLCS
eukprot:snap_masked-scaffold_7-processed-gene-11.32-mRNA-1 protein AED:1.00 eAED:1.00 QI:0/0/0/0/1/1/2/0/238